MYSVLYVDDEPQLLEIGQLYLQKYFNLRVTTVSSVQDAFKQLHISTFDVIISDYQMPETDGITFLKTLRKNQFSEPFILFTGKGREEVVIEALNSGADYYLQKGGEPMSQYTEMVNMIHKAVEKKRFESETIRAHRLSDEIINRFPDPAFVINTDRIVISWNHAIEKLTHISEADMLNNNISKLYSTLSGYQRPSLSDALFDNSADIQKWYTDIEQTSDTITAETVFTTRSGKEYTLWIKASLLYDENGTIIGAIETIRDITYRKQIELELQQKCEDLASSYEEIAAQNEEIRASFNEIEKQKDLLFKSELQFRSFIEHLPDGIIIHDQGIIQYVNPMAYRILGYDNPKDLIGISSLEIVHPQCRDTIVTRVTGAATMDNPFVKVIFVKQDETEIHVEIAGIRILIDGKISVMTIFRDITREQERKAALLQAQKKLKVLTSITRHDVNNELMAVMSILDVVSVSDIPQTEANLLKRAIVPCENILGQLKTTFEYQTIGVMEPDWFNLRSMIYQGAHHQQIEMSMISCSGLNVEVYADPLIMKVLENLMDNSVRHGKNLSNITCISEKYDLDLIVTYADDGGGIPDSDKEKIFQEGYGKHTGLGLFLITEILAMTGISIRECGVYGEGVKFEMRIPYGKWREYKGSARSA
jgi:PAS domain S-box-containing protein